MKSKYSVVLSLLLLMTGCATSYSWKSAVPSTARKITVTTFRNESDMAEIGSIATRQILRELQREGTFKIVSADEAALEIQGTVLSVSAATVGYNRRQQMRLSAAEATAVVEVTVVDKRNGTLLINNRKYQPTVSFAALQDMTTAERDASGRLADELSKLVVDDLLNLKW